MLATVATRDPATVAHAVGLIYAELFPERDVAFVAKAFGWAVHCFDGGVPGYQPIDVRYHDIEHTLQATLCLSHLLRGRHRAGAQPALTGHAFELVLIAVLLHDIGYLKTWDDVEGTGAKYTAIHVARSKAFAEPFLLERGFAGGDVGAVQSMIACTGVDVSPRAIPFRNGLERTLGFALATADLLGQMADPLYVAKLPLLFAEFAEAVAYAPAPLSPSLAFANVEALERNTPAFWDCFVLPRLEGEFEGVYRFLAEPYPDGPNAYLQQIEANLAPLRRAAAGADAGSN
jgi:hypothetical protein